MAEKKEKAGGGLLQMWEIKPAIETQADRDLDFFTEDALRSMTKENFEQEWKLWVGDGVETGQKATAARLFFDNVECPVIGAMFEDATRRFELLVKVGEGRGFKL